MLGFSSMRYSCFILLGVVSCLLLSSCGSDRDPPDASPQPRISLLLQLPVALARESPRFRRFLGRVISFELLLATKDGFSARRSFGPNQWEGISLSGLDFPRSEDDDLSIELRAWDRQRNGEPRSFAALSGKKKIRARDVVPREEVEVPLRLSLNVPAREY